MGGFNTQPPEGGWKDIARVVFRTPVVSTHSRLKAAGFVVTHDSTLFDVSTHSRLKAAGPTGDNYITVGMVSTHSRLKAAGFGVTNGEVIRGFQHTAA